PGLRPAPATPAALQSLRPATPRRLPTPAPVGVAPAVVLPGEAVVPACRARRSPRGSVARPARPASPPGPTGPAAPTPAPGGGRAGRPPAGPGTRARPPAPP